MKRQYKILIGRALSLTLIGSLFTSYNTLAITSKEKEGDLIISEYLHGPSNSKAIELFNGTSKDVDLSKYDIAIYSNGKYEGSPVSQSLEDKILESGDSYVIYNNQGKDENFTKKIDSLENKLGVGSQVVGFNGDDVILLRKNTGEKYEIVDSFGAKTEKDKKFYSSKFISARRKSEIKEGEKDIDKTPFDLSIEWNKEENNLYDDLGKHNFSFEEGEEDSKVIKIGEAREKNIGEEVNIRGVVTFNDRNKTLHIQDESGAIAVSNFKSGIDLSLGTKESKIEIKGKIDDFNGLIQVQADDIKFLEKGEMPEPKKVTIKELKEKNFDSQYIELKGVIINLEEKTLSKGEDKLDIYFVPTDLGLKTGDLIDVKGVVGRFKNNVQIYGSSLECTKVEEDLEEPKITHEKIEKADIKEDLHVEVKVEDNKKVEKVSLNFRKKGEKEFKNIPLKGEGNLFRVVIPKEELSNKGIEYYIEASDGQNISREPKEGVYFVELLDEDLRGPEITKIFPEENASLGENRRPYISGEFKDEASIDLESIKIKLNGKDITNESKISEEGFLYEVKEDLKDGEQVVEVLVRDSLGNETLKKWSFKVGKINHYYGQLHSHTNISDGTGSLSEAYKWAKDAGADYFAVTDHSNWFDNDKEASINDGSMSKVWSEAQNISDEFNKEGEFSALYGYEMTWSGSTGGWGHINTFNTPGFESRSNSSMDLKTYYDKIATLPKSVSQLNHPGKTFGDFADFGFYSEEADKVVNLIEVGNGEGPVRGSGYFSSYEYYTRALDKGWHVAPTNNQDNHKGKWFTANNARTVVLSEENSRDSLYEAMNKRQVYSSEDKNMTIDYTINNQIMGSSLGEVNDLNFNIEIKDKDLGDKIKKVSIIANGGVEVISKEFNKEEVSWNFNLDPEYSYYYVKVVQEDEDILVTAPIWVGDNLNIGLNEVKSDREMILAYEEAEISVEVYNNSSENLKDVKVEFFKDEISEENKIGEEKIDNLLGSSIHESSIRWEAERAGEYTIYARATVNLGNKEKIFTKSSKIKVVNPEDVYKVMIDGYHYNQYVTGNYKEKIDAFEDLLIKKDCIPIINKKEITEETLKGVDLLVLTDPQGTDDSEYEIYKSKFSKEEIEAIGKFVDKGGNVIITTRADYKDGVGEYSNSAQLNPILERIGSEIRVNDDQVADYEVNEGQQFRLMLNNYASPNYNLVSNLDKEDKFSFYSGASVILKEGAKGEKVDFLVSGHETTKTDDADKAKDNVEVKEGDVKVLAAEELKNGGKVVVGGSTFFSNFEIDESNVESKSNIKLTENILNWMLPKKEAKKLTIAEFREDKNKDGVPDRLGEEYVLEGIVTSQSEAVEPKNAFFEVIYIQDETGGINVFGVSNKPLRVGQKVRVKGRVEAYQGEFEIQISDENEDIEIIDESIIEVKPKDMTTKESMLHENEGWLTKVSGKVVNMDESNLYLDDGSGISRIYVEGYIWDGINEDMKGKWDENIEIGSRVEAIGITSEDPEGNRIRVRNTGEIVLLEGEDEKPGEDIEKPEGDNGTPDGDNEKPEEDNGNNSSEGENNTGSDEEGEKEESLPNTGGVLNSNGLLILGGLNSLLGAILISKKRRIK